MDVTTQGHVKAAAARLLLRQRSAERANLLTEDQLLSHAAVLHKTIDGQPVTPAKLAAFRLEVARVKRMHGPTDGITAQQAIDLSNRDPLKYTRQQHKPNLRSDFDKARLEIKRAVPASALKDVLRVVTNAGFGSKAGQHYVTIKFPQFGEVVEQVAQKRLTAKQGADRLRKGRLKFSCDCDRWQFCFSYVATIGNYNAGPPQRGFPKIRNVALRGCACKHVLRAVSELQSSGAWYGFLERHVAAAANKLPGATRSTKQEQAAKPSEIKTEEQRAIHRLRQRERDALNRAIKKYADKTPVEQAGMTRMMSRLDVQAKAKMISAALGIPQDKVLAKLRK